MTQFKKKSMSKQSMTKAQRRRKDDDKLIRKIASLTAYLMLKMKAMMNAQTMKSCHSKVEDSEDK